MSTLRRMTALGRMSAWGGMPTPGRMGGVGRWFEPVATDRHPEVGSDRLDAVLEERIVEIVRPHDDGVLTIAVVATADPGGDETETAIEGLGGIVADPDLEREGLDPASDRLVDEFEEQGGGEATPAHRCVGGDGGDVSIAGEDDEAGVAEHPVPHSGDDVVAVGAAEFTFEEPSAPRGRMGGSFDVDDGVEVASTQWGDGDRVVDRVHRPSRLDQLISASGLRR